MDIVERLRLQEKSGILFLPDNFEFVYFSQAADEIERLREALWEIWYLNASDKDNSIAMASIAYAALKEKE